LSRSCRNTQFSRKQPNRRQSSRKQPSRRQPSRKQSSRRQPSRKQSSRKREIHSAHEHEGIGERFKMRPKYKIPLKMEFFDILTNISLVFSYFLKSVSVRIAVIFLKIFQFNFFYKLTEIHLFNF
jgi:hypothetical protein